MGQWTQVRKGEFPSLPAPGRALSLRKHHCKVGKAKLHQLTKPFQRHVTVPQKPAAIKQIPSEEEEEEEFSSLGL